MKKRWFIYTAPLFLPILVLLVLISFSRPNIYCFVLCFILLILLFSSSKLRAASTSKLPLSIMLFMALLACFTPWMTPFSPEQQDINLGKDTNLMGIDALGRDIFARLLYANRSSLVKAGAGSFLANAIVLLFAFMLHTFRGYWKKGLDVFLQTFLSFPVILLFLMGASLGELYFDTMGPLYMILLVGVTLWAEPAKMTQARMDDLAHAEFIQAAELAGLGKVGLFYKEMLPNLKPLLVVNFLLVFIHAITLEAILGFMGIGLIVGEPNLGRMIYSGLNALAQDPWTFFSALGVFLFWIFMMRFFVNRIDRKRRYRNSLVFRGREGNF